MNELNVRFLTSGEIDFSLFQARLPGIYKQDYLRDLWDRYGGGKEEAPSAPSLPDWCYEEEDAQSDEDDDGPVNGIRDGPRVKRRRREHTIKVNMACDYTVGHTTCKIT